MLRNMFVAALLALAPSLVSAQPYPPIEYDSHFIDCAVGWVGQPPVTVALAVGGPDSSLDFEAAKCSEMIASGDWVGISKDGEWKPAMRWLSILQPADSPVALNVWTGYDLGSRAFGYSFSEAARAAGWTVAYLAEP